MGLLTTVLAAACAVAPSGAAAPEATSVQLKKHLCETTGGGEFVPLPGFPGEKFDRRLIRDVRFIRRRWPIFVTDGFSRSDVHARNGEHPLGLALDIIPDTSRGGTWREITDLARWAEPEQDHPRTPFRWVGYEGDPNHGRGNHLHLSWSHNFRTRPFHPARVVYTRICPGEIAGGGLPDQGGGETGGDGGGISTRLAPPVPEPTE